MVPITLLATVDFPDRTATEVAAQRLKPAAPLDELTREHRRWWQRANAPPWGLP
jgi:hypothetical protein